VLSSDTELDPDEPAGPQTLRKLGPLLALPVLQLAVYLVANVGRGTGFEVVFMGTLAYAGSAFFFGWVSGLEHARDVDGLTRAWRRVRPCAVRCAW
jgi:hypothetical protein